MSHETRECINPGVRGKRFSALDELFLEPFVRRSKETLFTVEIYHFDKDMWTIGLRLDEEIFKLHTY